VRKIAIQIAAEKSEGNTMVTVPVHPEFAESLRAARAAGIIGADVPHAADEQEGMGNEIRKICGPGRR
jgi:hypothetical protein